MSIMMRKKQVLRELMEGNFELPKGKQQIVRVVQSPGNNLHEVETSNVDDEHFLVSMPRKFRQIIWLKRGSYVLVEPIEEGKKVKAEICKILTPEYIEEYTKSNIWPEKFTEKSIKNFDNDSVNSKYVDSDSETDDLVPNMNRPMAIKSAEEDSDEDDEYTSSDEE